MGLREVSNILWRERHLLQLLLFKLEEEQLLLAAGRSRWLGQATREVELVLAEIKETELARALAVDAAGGQLDLGPNPSLRGLAEAAPAPWDGVFADHRTAFLAVTEEIVGLARTNRELLARGYQAAREMLAAFDGDRVNTYSPTGGGEASRALLVDRDL